jgi:hypothetical protein
MMCFIVSHHHTGKYDYKDATCLCVLVLYFVLQNWRVADDMPLYIKAPAISSNTGPDETWCQRPPCKTKQFQHTIVHKYNLVSTPKELVPSSYPNPCLSGHLSQSQTSI